MIGRFDRKFYIDLLRDIGEAEMSGILRLRLNRTLKALFFESGFLVFGISNLPDEELGQHLVNIGKLHSDHMRALQAQISRTTPFTELLKTHNLVSHGDLAMAQYEVIGNMAVSCINLEDGEYTFDGSKTADHEFKTQIRALDVLAEGIRRLRNDQYIRNAIGDLNQTLKPVFDIAARSRRINLNQLESQMLSLINQPRSITQFIKATGQPEMDVLRSLYVLLATGVLDPLEEQDEAQADDFDMASAASSNNYSMPLAPTAASPRVSGAYQKLSPLDQTYSSLQTVQQSTPTGQLVQPRKEAPKVEEGVKRGTSSKINTAKLEALAGIKIRSSAGPKESTTPEDARSEQWFAQGKQAMRLGDLRKAETLFRQASEGSPGKAKYLLALSLLLLKRPAGRKEAEGLLLRCCELEPQAIEPRLQLAGIYEQQNMTDKANQLYRSVLSIDPENPVATQKMKKDDSGYVGSLFKSILKK